MSPTGKHEPTSQDVRWWEIMLFFVALVVALVAGAVVVEEGMSMFNAMGFVPFVGMFAWFAWKHDIVGTPNRREP